MTRPRQLHLNAFLMGCGHHEAAWRLPESDPFANVDLGHWTELAQIAERGSFDSLFLADGPALLGHARYRPGASLEPTILLTALAAVTSHIGLIATASTTYNDPYNLARRFASLDHISGGRAGWNIVTTASRAAARNFGLDDKPSHRERYRRAAEFTDVSLALWDSWEDGAQVGDKTAGVFADQAKIHPIDYQGDYFQVAGPLNVPRSPQGRPLLVQAGSSEDGREFAARYAEAVFTAQQTLVEAQEFYADMKARARRIGRNPDEIKILPGLVPFVGSTEAEARALEDELEDLIVPEYSLLQLSNVLEIPVSELALDEPLPESVTLRSESGRPPVEGAQSRYRLIVDLARRDSLTVRQLIGRLGGGRGHRTFAGTPEQVADTIQEWAESGAADGFNVMPAVLPSGLELFTEHVVPVLRQRGLFRHDYSGITLRDHYNLPRPASRHSRPLERAVGGALRWGHGVDRATHRLRGGVAGTDCYPWAWSAVHRGAGAVAWAADGAGDRVRPCLRQLPGGCPGGDRARLDPAAVGPGVPGREAGRRGVPGVARHPRVPPPQGTGQRPRRRGATSARRLALGLGRTGRGPDEPEGIYLVRRGTPPVR